MRNNTLNQIKWPCFGLILSLALSTNFILLQVFPILLEEIDREVRMADP